MELPIRLQKRYAYAKLIRHLKEETSNIRAAIKLIDSEGSTVLHTATEFNDESNVYWLVRSGGLNVNAQTKNGTTPLMLAVKKENLHNVRCLIAANADINIVNNHGESVLNMIPKRYKEAVISRTILMKLIEECSTIEQAAKKMFDAKIPFHLMGILNRSEIINFYLDKNGVDVNIIEPVDQITVLHMAVLFHDSKSVELLLSRGADINAKDRRGYAPIMYVAPEMFSEAMKIRTQYCKIKQVKVLKILLHHGADLITWTNNNGCMQLYAVLRHCCKEAVQLLLETNINLNATDGYGRNLFHYLAGNLNSDVFELLRYKNFEINARINSGDSILHTASWYGSTEAVQFLLDRGANINSQNDFRQTPIEFTIRNKYPITKRIECLELLLQYGADVRFIIGHDFTILKKLNNSISNDFINPVLANLAILEATGTIIENDIVMSIDNNISYKESFEMYKLQLKQFKETIIYESLSQFDILIASEKNLSGYLQNEDLVSKLKLINNYNNEHNMYYYRLFSKRIDCVLRKLQLKKRAEDSLYRIMRISNGYYPIITDKILSYLGYQGLLQLSDM